MNPAVSASFPVARPRRVRHSAILREMVAETRLSARQLILPLFVRPGRDERRPISSMPGVFQLSVDQIVVDARKAFEAGVPGVILFGIPPKKDAHASGAYARNGIVQQAVRALKKALPDLLVVTDVCLCEYMSHGHCGLVKKGPRGYSVVNDPSLELLAKTAVSHAEAGADIIAPSDMMDGRVGALRRALDGAGFEDVPIMSYAVKYASAFYGPFREAAESAPQFGDRRSYQMNPANIQEGLREAALDIQEGADILLVKPALAYLDVIQRVKSTFGYPTAAYAVSGEFSMIQAAAAKGWLDEKAATMEALMGIRRAGADIIITYSAVQAAQWIGGALR